MKFDVLTLFPEMIEQGFNTSITGRAVSEGILELNTVNIRDYSKDKHNKVDDYIYGGGAGMLMFPQPVYDAYKSLNVKEGTRVVYLTPVGQTFNQKMAKEFAMEDELVFLCGHYEGIDERVIETIVTDKVSIGDYVLTGGELPVLVMMDAISRMVPGVLGNGDSSVDESFSDSLLEYPQYSRPEEWNGMKVPPVLLSGDHKKIDEWRLERSLERTRELRPDMYEKWAESHPEYFELQRKKKKKAEEKARKLAKKLAKQEML
ncbi:MAG: tRNA (guanosine(37)-N1)-methyltransferase TrmD [Lachnospiraceae bacterium]|nr:tRNA (guanosine(37)-N1)-methyltransferase TrmD [Lachnospiraceae bacterium]